MRRTLALAVLVLAVVPAASGQTVTLYEHVDYAGKSVKISKATRELGSGWNDKTSSVRITGGTWKLCRHYDYTDCRMMAQGVADLRSIGFNDAISSMRPVDPAPPAFPHPDRAGRGQRPGGGEPGARQDSEHPVRRSLALERARGSARPGDRTQLPDEVKRCVKRDGCKA